MENENFADFFGQMAGGDGNQTDAELEVTEQETAQEEPAQEPTAPAGSEEASDAGAEEKPPESQETAERFTLKVNRQERVVSRDEVIALAQKGADYDRVKAAEQQAKSDNEALRELNGRMQEAYDLVTELAQQAKVTVAELLDNLRIEQLKASEGISADVARERIARQRAERELEKLRSGTQAPKTSEQTGQERAAKDVAAFRKEFPDVELTQELMDKLLPGVRDGKSMIEAYRCLEDQRKDEEIQRLTQELAAAKQNKANRAASPGSTSNSGSRKVKGEFEDFFAALGKP